MLEQPVKTGAIPYGDSIKRRFDFKDHRFPS